jgi:hypothetical protein
MSWEEAKTQWGVDGMPADKQRLAKAMYEAGQRDMRDLAACICQNIADQSDDLCLADDAADAIRAIKLESEQ